MAERPQLASTKMYGKINKLSEFIAKCKGGDKDS
jgi:hypothetical protein